jgi:hypothetical protein
MIDSFQAFAPMPIHVYIVAGIQGIQLSKYEKGF